MPMINIFAFTSVWLLLFLTDAKNNQGETCMKKVVMVEEFRFDEVKQCQHVDQESCFEVHEPDFSPQQVQKCQNDFRKKCHIEYDKVPKKVNIRTCRDVIKRDCQGGGEAGDLADVISSRIDAEICTMQDSRVCETSYLMEDDETECDDGDDDESICILSPVGGEDNSVGSIRTPRVLGTTNCVVVRERVCGQEECPITTERVCIEEEREAILERPSERCELIPHKNCRMVTKMLPSLNLVKRCVNIPKEVCGMARINPRKIRRPAIKTWCKPAQRKPMTKLVVVGGMDSESVWHNDVQVVNIDRETSAINSDEDGNPCWLPPVPGPSIRGASAYLDGSAYVCTGSTLRCFRLNTTSADGYKWEQAHFFQPRIRTFPTAITMNDKGEWWVTGGADKDRKNLASTIRISPSSGAKGFSRSPIDLPLPLKGHSLVQLNDTHFFLYGGYLPSTDVNLNRAWILNAEEGVWVEQDASAEGRRKAFVGLVNIEGEQHILVSGGFNPAPLSSAELFSLSTLKWSPAPPMPQPRAGGAAVMTEEGHMLVVAGSLEQDEDAKRILRFDSSSVSWSETDFMLSRALYHISAFLAPSDFAPTCDNLPQK